MSRVNAALPPHDCKRFVEGAQSAGTASEAVVVP